MSVEMVIEYADGRTHKVFPIRAGGFYAYYWTVMPKKLGLTWIPLFSGGLPVEDEYIPAIINELTYMAEYLSNDRNFRFSFSRKKTRQEVISRIEYLIEGLNEVRKNPNAKVYIG
jgi:hypothetical protein